MKLSAVCILTLSLIAVLALPAADAWSNGGYSSDQNNPDYGTHDWIVERALAMQTSDVTFMTSTYHARLLLGTEAPDNPAFIGDTGEHHVYYRSTGALQDNSSASRAAAVYGNALGYLDTGNYEEATYCVGAMSHYIADAGVFGHTMGSATDWGTETHHSDYENHVQSMTDTLSAPAGISLGNLGAYEATLGLAYDATFGAGPIKPNTWMDTHYSWAEPVFYSSAMASLNASVEAVAATINHLMTEWGASAPVAVPPAPTELNGVWTKATGVVIGWAAPSGGNVETYTVYRGTSLDERAPVATVQWNVLGWTDTKAEAGKTYYYWVSASNSVGTSDLSAPISVSVPGHSDPWVITIIVAACSAAVASVGALAVRSRRLSRQRR